MLLDVKNTKKITQPTVSRKIQLVWWPNLLSMAEMLSNWRNICQKLAPPHQYLCLYIHCLKNVTVFIFVISLSDFIRFC